MSIIEVTHLTKEYRLGAMQSLKHKALDDIATEAALAAKTWNWCLTPFADCHLLTAEDIQACLAYAADRERHQIAVAA